VLAGRVTAPCPSGNLTATDAGAVRALVTFLAARGNTGLALVEDDSPRSAAAARVVRETAARFTIAISAPDGARRPLIVVTGWQKADELLRDVKDGRLPAQGTYLAPWLVTAPLMAIPAAELTALPYNPGDASPIEYANSLAEGLPAAPPSASGYAAWLSAEPVPGPFRIYAISPVDLALVNGEAHGHAGHTWFPAGAITPVSAPITPQ